MGFNEPQNFDCSLITQDEFMRAMVRMFAGIKDDEQKAEVDAQQQRHAAGGPDQRATAKG
jgi:hypothetical protein